MTDRLRLSPPQNNTEQGRVTWFNELYERVGEGPFLIRGYTVTTVPAATSWGDGSDFSAIVFISDESGGATLAFSDGTNWRRVTDNAIIT